MSINYHTLARTAMRRSDRGVTDENWIKALLHRAPLGYVATVAGDQPFINANLFVYDEVQNAIYLHTARKGRLRSNVDAAGSPSGSVCFTVAEMGRLLPADEALEFSVEYRSVIVFGRIRLVEELETATHVLQQLLDKYFAHLQAGRDYRPPVPEELKRTSVYAIDIEEWTGKKKEVAPDFPGAFLYPAADFAAYARPDIPPAGPPEP